MKERYLLEDGGDNSFSLITDYDGNDEQAFDVIKLFEKSSMLFGA